MEDRIVYLVSRNNTVEGRVGVCETAEEAHRLAREYQRATGYYPRVWPVGESVAYGPRGPRPVAVEVVGTFFVPGRTPEPECDTPVEVRADG